jgi:hypothetical protein
MLKTSGNEKVLGQYLHQLKMDQLQVNSGVATTTGVTTTIDSASNKNMKRKMLINMKSNAYLNFGNGLNLASPPSQLSQSYQTGPRDQFQQNTDDSLDGRESHKYAETRKLKVPRARALNTKSDTIPLRGALSPHDVVINGSPAGASDATVVQTHHITNRGPGASVDQKDLAAGTQESKSSNLMF